MEYDGTDFAGWQVQTNHPTIQGALERAISTIVQTQTRVTGAGRTDTGVHATGQVAHFDVARAWPLLRLQCAVNALLPRAIAIRQLEEAPDEFHARYSARRRTYSYSIYNSQHRSPLRERFSLHVGSPLDIDRMAAAAELLVGEHDFGSFGTAPQTSAPDRTRSTVRHIFASTVEVHGPELRVTVVANAFLRRMMRSLAALLIDVGVGSARTSDVRLALERVDTSRRSRVAPPHGLCLVAVDYYDSGRIGSAKNEDV